MNDTLASAPALAETTGSSDPMAELTAFFESGNDQVDNSNDTEQVEGNPQADTEANTEEPATEEAAVESGDEAKPDAEVETADEPSGFDALESEAKSEFLESFDDIKAKYPRNSSNELVAEMARYGKAAKEGQEAIEAVGGPEFLPGVKAITQSLREGNHRGVFEGVAQTAGPEGLVYSIAEAMKLGFVEADALASSKDPMHQHFGTAMKAVTDSIVEQRFGEGVTTERLSKLVEWDQAGWFEKIEQWIADEYIDSDEIEELLSTSKDPEKIALKQELKRLKQEKEGQLGKEKADEPAKQQQRSLEVENSFDQMATEKLHSLFNDVIWKNSVLRDLPTDSPETKQGKAFLREGVLRQAETAFKTGDARAKLIQGFQSGARTPIFLAELAKSLNAGALSAKPVNSVAERLAAALQGKSRNSQLAQKNVAARRQVRTYGDQTPTETTKFGSQSKPHTDKEIVDDIARELAAMGLG